MLQSGYFFLGKPKNMNDQYEWSCGDTEIWERTYFASFMAESSESIGMWSMYAQPWAEGVRLSIPKGICKKWIDSTDVLHKVFDKSCTLETVEIADSALRWGFESVVYAGLDKDGKSKNRFGSQSNTILENLTEDRSLTGFVKDNAWSYEKEIRLKVTLKEAVNCDRLAIKMTDEVINSLLITPSPLFQGDFMEKLEESIRSKVSQDNLSDSLFRGKLENVDPCKECAKICEICKMFKNK